MKVELNKEHNGFKPVELTITIESRDELLDMWHRFNIGGSVINGENKYKGGSRPLPDVSDCYKAWSVVDRLVRDRGIR